MHINGHSDGQYGVTGEADMHVFGLREDQDSMQTREKTPENVLVSPYHPTVF